MLGMIYTKLQFTNQDLSKLIQISLLKAICYFDFNRFKRFCFLVSINKKII